MAPEVYISLLGVIVASGGTYLIARRKASGRVDTTEAAVLWKQSQAMRKELRDEVVDLKEQLREARAEIVELRNRVKELEAHS